MTIKLSDSLLDGLSVDNTFPEDHPFNGAVWVDVDDVPAAVAEDLAEALETNLPEVSSSYGEDSEGYQFLMLPNGKYALLPLVGEVTVAYQD